MQVGNLITGNAGVAMIEKLILTVILAEEYQKECGMVIGLYV